MLDRFLQSMDSEEQGVIQQIRHYILLGQHSVLSFFFSPVQAQIGAYPHTIEVTRKEWLKVALL
ncbi:hypothetical protein DFP94_101103 [Fontibacillus phaseoli]|uniref:Uncharacterized protein n=2 Tax=Fontibacillus phaseoli TaxID=1416533 RepID=A0A369BLU0_9BACL|nr:hypothetical protein DFP94_101103 [Fontibacillus phaseoli]